MMTSEPLAWVIDDEPAIVDIVTFALETQGFRWRSFHAAGPAWTALRSEQPDLIVLDVMLPDMTGIELCRRIRDRWNIPVLLLTAKGRALIGSVASRPGPTTTSRSRSTLASWRCGRRCSRNGTRRTPTRA